MKLGIGIDTGGTCTDAVIYDFETETILGAAKAPTTREDLSRGILRTLDALPPELTRRAERIALSTTLATNACVEETYGRARLIFFGGDSRVINAYGPAYGLPPAESIYLQDSFTHFSGEIEREPDWEQFRRGTETGFDDLDGVGIVEINALRNGAVVEKKAREIFQAHHSVPVVCGHELVSGLNCLQRASGALLNAALFPVIHAFLNAVRKALEARGIHAPLVIVRSDGSLMQQDFAALRPVETLLSGPAASALGSARLTHSPSGVIVDMGGTTTDIALVKDGHPVTVTDGVAIGKWRTFVDGLYVKTFGLGGDTALHYADRALYLENYRVMPLCQAAREYPAILENLRRLTPRKHTHFLYEHYLLVKDIRENPRYTPEEKAFCAALKAGPLPCADAAAAVGRDLYQLDAGRLVRDGVVQLCGLTPTDVMHIRGDFTAYNGEASRLAAEFAAYNLEISVEELGDRAYDAIRRRLYTNIVAALMENRFPRLRKEGFSDDLRRLMDAAYEEARTSRHDPLFSPAFRSEAPLIGVGAPIALFLPDVARMLGTRAILPAHYAVANALGAVASSVCATCTVEIGPVFAPESPDDYVVFARGGSRGFREMKDAVAFAEAEARAGAEAEARKRGAVGALAITTEVQTRTADARSAAIDLGAVVIARAVGALRL